MKKNHSVIQKQLLRWYDANKRDMPWRQTTDAYKIWLSEIILQQTRVEQGLPYYNRFVHKYKNVKAFANANESEILKQWQGLGYYSRARNMHTAAKQVVEWYNGIFPANYDELIKLKGVGEYTASAIASIAYGLPHAVCDGNVFRVLSRLYSIDTPINSTEGKKIFFHLAQSLLNHRLPSQHNQAMMELGALVCKPTNPLCGQCTVNAFCKAHLKNTIDKFPAKNKKPKSTVIHLHYFVFDYKGHTYMQMRTGKSIWQGLHDFPNMEYAGKENSPEQSIQRIQHMLAINKMDVIKISHEYKHILTHRIIIARFIHCSLHKPLDTKKYSLIKIKKTSINTLSLPRLIEKYYFKEMQ
jgi:A/G-specific adenine glycosylase